MRAALYARVSTDKIEPRFRLKPSAKGKIKKEAPSLTLELLRTLISLNKEGQ